MAAHDLDGMTQNELMKLLRVSEMKAERLRKDVSRLKREGERRGVVAWWRGKGF